ncbi:MAG: SAM-dependent methyltransferase, partial [Okeania sp. SIO2D1]|nr:SAM-dependent methyltransferase [Okeania sp. SIO2D1]
CEYWNIERLIGKSSELVERVVDLDYRERYRLIELLDSQISHYEFFLGRPPLAKIHWSDDRLLLAAIPELSPCIQGWPSENIFDGDYKLVNLSREEYEFLQACDTESNSQSPSTVGEILANVPVGLEIVRSLQSKLLILLTPGSS